MIHIRYATAQDAELIADISRQTFHETFAAENNKEHLDKFLQGVFSKETLIKNTKEPGNIFFLAYDEDMPVGYVKMRENDNPQDAIDIGLKHANVIEIARIYATTNVIGQGVGKILMQKCIDIAVKKKKNIIWLGVWEKNHRAIDFYIKWGFEKFGTHVFMLGDDPQLDWLMKKEI